MIGVGFPYLSIIPFRELLPVVAEKFEMWELLPEGEHHFSKIENEFAELTPNYDLKFQVHLPMSDINIGSMNPTVREAAVKEIIYAMNAGHRLGIRHFTVHPGFLSPVVFKKPEKVKEMTLLSLKEIDREANDLGITVAVENMPDFSIAVFKTADEMLELVEGIGLSICWDVGHSNASGIPGCIDGFLEIRDRITNIHLHDNDGSGDQHLTLGEGKIDFPRIIKELDSDRVYVIEAVSIESAVESTAYLKGLLS